MKIDILQVLGKEENTGIVKDNFTFLSFSYPQVS